MYSICSHERILGLKPDISIQSHGRLVSGTRRQIEPPAIYFNSSHQLIFSLYGLAGEICALKQHPPLFFSQL